MRVIPAIDLMNGRLTRLSRGAPETAKYYEAFGDPVETAMHWKREGADFLHVVDLNAALGSGDNRILIMRILGEIGIPVQVGGGLRSTADVNEILRLGASRAIVGTLAFENTKELRLLLNQVGSESVVVALDYVEGKVVTRGWKQKTELLLIETLRSMVRKGVRMFLLTAVGRDGLMVGPDIETLSKCTGITGAKIIAAGGIGNLQDLAKLKEVGVTEVVVGKALYEGRFTLREALAKFTE